MFTSIKVKRIVQILTIALILFSTIGVSVTKHYCGNVLRIIAINSEPSCCDDEEMPVGCCHNETEHFSINDDFQLQAFDFKLNLPFDSHIVHVYAILNPHLDNNSLVQNSKLTLRSHPPAESDIIIRNQTFLI